MRISRHFDTTYILRSYYRKISVWSSCNRVFIYSSNRITTSWKLNVRTIRAKKHICFRFFTSISFTLISKNSIRIFSTVKERKICSVLLHAENSFQHISISKNWRLQKEKMSQEKKVSDDDKTIKKQKYKKWK